jgi:hypothetical protein
MTFALELAKRGSSDPLGGHSTAQVVLEVSDRHA